MSCWQPMAKHPRREPMNARDWFDAALVIAAIVVVCYYVGLLVPVGA
jgi:hypothetical protein